MNVAEVQHDLAVRHRIGLGRYSTTVVRRVLALLNRVEAEVVQKIVQADNLGRNTVQLDGLLLEVRRLEADGWATVRSRLNGDLADLAATEIKFNADLLTVGASQTASVQLATNIPTLGQVVSAANARPFQGRLLREWLAETEEGAAKRVRGAIRQGFVEGESVANIVKRIRGTRALGYKDGIMETSRRGAEAMVRTAVTHYSSVASQETYKAAGSLVTGIVWVSTLDARTTPLCQSLDGKEFPLDSGPRPPAHINCRSTTIPRMKGIPPIQRTTYGEWIKKQPAGVQDEILGPTRGKLLRSGGLTVDRFVDNKGVTLTLDQLKAKDASAFERAGLASRA